MSCGQHRLELTQLIELISACRPIRLALKCIVSSPNIGCGHTITNAPHPFPNCEAKCDWVSIVVVWGTDREQDDAATFFLFFFEILSLPKTPFCIHISMQFGSTSKCISILDATCLILNLSTYSPCFRRFAFALSNKLTIHSSYGPMTIP